MSEFSGAVRTIRGLAAATAIIAACPARGEDALCGSIPELSANPALVLGHITSAVNVHFIKDAGAQPGCPSRAPACAERAYLVPGDRVIVSTRRDAFVCATYINARGIDRSGWLPADAVAHDDGVAPVAPADWLGKWSRIEADITVKAGKAGALRIEGDATFGAKDPARVRRGAVNLGNIEGDVTPAGDRLSFAIGDGATLPVDKGDEFGCKVWMRRVGPWLIVNDNNNCGGFNVTFRGFYTRKP